MQRDCIVEMKSRRVVLVPGSFQGHITPMLQLGTILHSRGFSITVVHTSFNSPDPSYNPEFEFRAIPDGLSDEILSSGNFTDIIFFLNESCRQPFQECLAQMVKQQERDEIACVICDEIMYFSVSVADKFEIQSIKLHTANAVTAISRLALLRIKEEGYLPLQGIAHFLRNLIRKSTIFLLLV